MRLQRRWQPLSRRSPTLADFTASNANSATAMSAAAATENGQGASGSQQAPAGVAVQPAGALTLSHDIHLHLPPTSDVAVYRAIFQAMKSELM
jgi:hypothetical protein